MAHDYLIKWEHDGTHRSLSYQKWIRALEIEDEQVHGAPLSAGHAPQALFLQSLLAKTGLSNVRVFFQGSQIF